jgi:hypothetical protein
MICPSCGAEQRTPSRFCDACGLSMGVAPSAFAEVDPAEEPLETTEVEVRCLECGMTAQGKRCRGCGAPIKWPEDLEPTDA